LKWWVGQNEHRRTANRWSAAASVTIRGEGRLCQSNERDMNQGFGYYIDLGYEK
jgi:hypothetical protein